MPDGKPKYKIEQDVLNDFVVTLNSQPNLSREDVFKKFPEFNNDVDFLQSALDYHSTVNTGKYKTVEELNLKFPEFDVKKKEQTGLQNTNGNTGQQSTLGGQGNPFVQPPNVSNVQVPNAPTKQPTVEQEWTAPRFDKPKNVVVPNIGEIPNTAPPPIKQEGLPQRLKTFKESLSSIVNNPEDEDLYVLKNPKNKDLTQGLEDERLNEENVNTLLEKMRVKYDKENPNTPIQPYELLKIKEDLRNNFNSRKITIDAFNIASSKTQKETGINPVTSNFLSKPDRVKLLEEQTKSKKLYKKQSGEIKNQFDLVIDESSVKFSEISKQLQKQYQTEFDATILPIQQQLQDKYQQLVNSGQIDEQTANQQLKQELGQAQEEIQKQLGEQYQPKFNELNSAIQNENKLIQTRFNQKQTELTNRVNTYNKEQFDKYVSKYDIPQNVKDSFEKNFEDSLKEVYVKKNKEAMQQWSNLSRTDQLTKTLQVGTVDVLESVAGLLGYVKFNEAHLVTKDLFDKFMSDNQLPEINLKDENSMYDWLVVNGVRSIPIMAASLPGSFAGARLGAGLAQSIISTSKLSKTIGSLIGGGIGDWSVENMFFERMLAFNDALEQGFTLEQASNIAVTVGKYDLATIPLKIIEMAPIFGKGLKFITSPLATMSSGGLEEIIQGYATTRAVELEKQRLGQFTTDTSWFEYFVSPRALEEGVLGAAMGGMFSVTGALTNNSQQVQQMTMQNALSKFGEDKTRTLLDMMYFNDIMTEEEHKTALSNLDKNVKAAEFVQVFSPKIQAPLMNMLVANEILEEQKTGNLMLDTAIDAAKKKNEGEISKIINGDTPVYSYTQGDKTPIVVTKEQMLSNIADPEFIKGVKNGTFKVDLTNDAAMQKKLDEALLEETEKPKVKKGKAKEKGTIIVNDKIIESLTPEEKVTAKIKAKLSKPDKTKVVKKEDKIKTLEEEYNSTPLEELRALKKKLYSNVNIESPMSPEEKLLDKVIAKKFGDLNQQVIQKRKRKIEKEASEVIFNDKELSNNEKIVGLVINSEGKGIIGTQWKEGVKENPEAIIKEISDQITANEQKVRDIVGDNVVDLIKAEKPEMVPANPQIDKTYEGAKVDKVQEKPNAKEKGAKAPPPKLPITVKNIENANIDNSPKKQKVDSQQKVQTKKEGKEPQKAVPEKVESESEKRKSQDINNLAGIVNEYNALSPHQKTTKNGKDYVQRILNGSRKLGFTMSQNNSNRKITVKKENGKKLTKIGKTEQLPEPDKADVIHALQEIDKGILIWNGDVLSPHIDLGIEWGDIRKGEKDLKSGKMTVPAKRLVEALRQAKEKDNYDFVVGGGAARGITHSVTLLEATPEQIETTEQEDAEITANELPLRNEYIEYFDSLPLSEQEKEFNSLYDEVAERRSQTAATQNPSQDISKKDVPDKKTPLELASEKRRAAKEKLRAQGLGIASDPKHKAKLLLEYHEALVGEAKEYIKLGVKTGKEFAKAIGEKFTKAVKEAWLEATGKTPPKTDNDFEEVFEQVPKEEKQKRKKSKGRKLLDKLANNIPETGEILPYLSGQSIFKHTGEKSEADQARGEIKLRTALEHGIKIVEQAKKLWGERYVENMLKYIRNSTAGQDSKALMYVSLENSLGKEKLENPERATEIAKYQKLVHSHSQLYGRELGVGLGMFRLRKVAQVGYDIDRIYADFFSEKELESKQELEEAVQADAETVQKRAEEIEKAIAEGVQAEVDAIYENMPPVRRKKTDAIIAKLEKFQIKLRYHTFSDVTGVFAITDFGVSATITALKTYKTLAEAIEIAIGKMRTKFGKFDEAKFRTMAQKEFASELNEGIDGKKQALIKRLEAGIESINQQIKNRKREVKKKDGTFDNDADIIKLREQRAEKRKELKQAVPKSTQLVKQALIKAGFGKTIKVKGESVEMLNWRKLAGEAGTVERIKENVENVLGQTHTPEQIADMQVQLIQEYKNLRKSIILKAQTELARRNKEVVTAEQKSAAKKLAELYTMGLFESEHEKFENTLNRALGARVSEEGFNEARKIAEAMEQIYSSSFKGVTVNDVSAMHPINVLADRIRVLLFQEGKRQGTPAFKRATFFRSWMDIGQSMILLNMKQAIENPKSGLQASLIEKIGSIGQNTAALRKARRSQANTVFRDMVFKGSIGYGKIENTFVNRKHLDDLINRLPDNDVVHFLSSLFSGKTILNAADSLYKSSIVRNKFVTNLIKIMTDPTNKNKISKEDALIYISEALTGQTLEKAQETARDIIAKINKKSGKILIPENQASIDRFANDIVLSALEMGGKIDSEMIMAAFNAAYNAGSLNVGHKANNPLSEMVQGHSALLESDVNQAIKNKDWKRATTLTVDSVWFRTFMNPFVGGGTNWLVLSLELAGGGLFTGAYSQYKYGKMSRLDLSTTAGRAKVEEGLLNQARIKDRYLRGLIGGGGSLLIYAALKGIFDDEDEEKYRLWLKENPWAARLINVLTPTWMVAEIAARNGNIAGFFNQLLNRGDAYDATVKIIKSADYMAKYVATDNEKYLNLSTGAFGEAVGSKFNFPVPWRLVRDNVVIYQGAKGQDPYHGDYKPSTSLLNGFAQGGLIEFMGYRPEGNPESKGTYGKVNTKGSGKPSNGK